mmetsp:Transcript_6145/g.16700  ORF Transcript_6145/g.16700 Transcript_6145/m.16700 type:complete len:148 (-) Transcript_6145:127-570(-)
MGSYCEVVRCCPTRLGDPSVATGLGGEPPAKLPAPIVAPVPPAVALALPPVAAAGCSGPRPTLGREPLAELRRNADRAMAEMEAVFDTGLFGTTETPSWVWTSASNARCSTIPEVGGIEQGSSNGDIRWATHFWDSESEKADSQTPR